MPHGELKSACDALNQLALQGVDACPSANPQRRTPQDAATGEQPERR